MMSAEELKRIFSKNLNHFLTLNNKTQIELGKYMGVSAATVSDWCNGKKLPRVDKIQYIATWLGIEYSELIKEPSDDTPTYYYDKYARDLIDFLHKNPDYKVLFDASRKVKQEDIEFVKMMIEKVGGNDE